MSHIINAFLATEITCIPQVLDRYAGKYYSNTISNGATWVFFMWHVLHFVFEESVNLLLKKMRIKEYVRARLKQSVWYLGFYITSFFYCTATLYKNNIDIFSHRKLLSVENDTVPGYLILGFIVLCTFYAHSIIWEGLKKGFSVSSASYLFLTLFILLTYFCRMPPKKNMQYSKESLRSALAAIKNGPPCATAAKIFNIPRSTLIGKLKGTYPEECKVGVATILTIEEENILVRWIIDMSKRGFPITKEQLLDSVAILVKNLKRLNKFSVGRPGRHWYEGFLHRHPEISLRMAQNLTATRATITENSVRSWFREINEHFNNTNIVIDDPRRIFNADESAFFLSPKGNNVLAKKGSKAVYNRVGGDEKECLTVLITGNAAGQQAPPMVMYSYERIPKYIVSQIPSGWAIGKSESGWMTSESFYEYITNVLHPWLLKVNITFPIILYVDGHISHITLPLSDFCREKNIVLISLLPNSTHILQPLDVGLFKSLKNSWKKCIHDWRRENGQKHLKRENFATVLQMALDEIKDIKSIFANAFRVCGVFPFNANSVDYSKLLTQTENLENKVNINPEVDKHLKFIEKQIEKTKLEKFYQLRGHNWEGNIEDTSLYYFWLSVFKMAGLTFASQQLSVPDNSNTNNGIPLPTQYNNNNIIIEIEDGLILGDDWMDLVVNNEVQGTEVESIEESWSEKGNYDKLADQVTVDKDNQSLINEQNGNKRKTEIVSGNEVENKESNAMMSSNKQNIQTNDNHQDENQKENEICRLQKQITTVEPGRSNSDNSPKKQNVFDENTDKILGNDLGNTAQTLKKINASDKSPNSKKENIDTAKNCIPSPFKKSLFWPEEVSQKKALRKKKEKIPSVTTSDAWREYYSKKESEKQKLEAEKEERKRKREENRKLNEQKSKRLRSSAKEERSTSEPVDPTLELQNKNITASNKNIDKTELVVNDYVIVKYEGEYYPGLIKKIEDNRAFISTMQMSGFDKWKWPQEIDEIWYELDEIIDKIEPPEEVNKRGFYVVQEIKKYQSFTS